MNKLRGDSLKKWLQNRPVAVVGLGQSGLSAARCLLKLGAKLFLSESKPKQKFVPHLPKFFRKVAGEFGRHTKNILKNDLIVVSPGVPSNLPVLAEARKKRIPVWNELELGWRVTEFRQTVAVTGTNGKTTTVSMIADICRRAGCKTLVAGNIGKPLCDFYSSHGKFDLLLLEVSSYQLESIETFHPNIAMVLNLTADHLHRHLEMHRYAKAKERIFLNQSADDFAILNADDAWCKKMSRNCSAQIVWFSTRKKVAPGVFYDAKNRRIAAQFFSARPPAIFPLPSHLTGLHNIENSCAAIAACLKLKIAPDSILESLKHFQGVKHRLEKVLQLHGATYINDSKATNVDSTLKALQSFTRPIWLIMGGEDKGDSYLPLKSSIAEKVKGIFLIGEAAKKIYSELTLKDESATEHRRGSAASLKVIRKMPSPPAGTCDFFFSGTLSRAVADAARNAMPGDVVLLSPACASFDQFKNFEDRGDQFKRLVKGLK